LLFLIILFSILVHFHTILFAKRTFTQNQIQINENEIKYLNNDYSPFDEGKDFVDFNHPYTYDLDVFGESSLFQSLARVVTYQGRLLLAQLMSQPVLSESEILSRQTCIKELKDKIDFRQHFQATGLLLKETTEREALTNWIKDKYCFYNQKFLPYFLLAVPLFSIVLLIISAIRLEIQPLLIFAFVINTVLYSLNRKKITALYSLVSKKKLLLESYSDLMKIVHEQEFKTRELEELRLSLQNGSDQIKKLSNYVGWFDLRLNLPVNIIVNSLFLFDLQCCYQIEKWRSINEKNIFIWLNSLGKSDALISLANFAYNNPEFAFPDLSSENLSIDAKELSHPLIAKKKRVPNDFNLGEGNKIAIITGANMAGKSTFLRTLGINIVLSYTGAPACARYFKIPIMDLISSMRISDSLKDDVSYFYAELKRLKVIRKKVESGHPTLILLDEMLRGTNSKDKQQGSKSFMENLLNYNCLSLLATHDLLLGNMEEDHPFKIKNFCFESIIQNDELIFDYKIIPGIAQTTNASFLMKKLGII